MTYFFFLVLVQKTLFKHELCLADRKFIMTAIPAPSNFNTYLKDIASNNVNLLITFNYRLVNFYFILHIKMFDARELF